MAILFFFQWDSTPRFKLAANYTSRSPVPTGNIKNPIFIGTIFSKKSKIINAWQRKKYHGITLPWQKPWQSSYKSSLGVILKSMFSYYKPVKYMVIICITTSIIYTFNTHGKYSNPQAHHLN